jgi:hypothetical protein
MVMVPQLALGPSARLFLPSVTAACVGIVVAACNRTPPIQSGAVEVQDTSRTSQPLRAAQLPQGCRRNRPPSTPAELTACLQGLDFEDTIEAVGDQQQLMIHPPCPASCRYGPLATIQPEKHSHLYSYDELNEGRIIAKLFLDPKEIRDYRKLGLVPGGVTYWWVQKTSENPDSAGRSVYITLVGEKLRPPVENTLKYTEHENGFQQAVARWVWDPLDEKTQGTCGQGCCH